MTDNIVHVFGGPQNTDEPDTFEPIPACIEALEHWLTLAREGDLAGIAFVGLHSDGRVGYTLTGRVWGFGMLGALHMLQQDIVDVNMEIQ
jgi:hypothetical protein